MFAKRNRLASPHVPRRQSGFHPRLEALEDRLLLTMRIWTGAGTPDSLGHLNWMDPNNWQNHILPVTGDDLRFPAEASGQTNYNNFTNATFHSIEVESNTGIPADYRLSGNPLTLTDHIIVFNFGNVNLSLTISFTIQLAGAARFSVLDAALQLGLVEGGFPLTLDNQSSGTPFIEAINTEGDVIVENGHWKVDLPEEKGTTTVSSSGFFPTVFEVGSPDVLAGPFNVMSGGSLVLDGITFANRANAPIRLAGSAAPGVGAALKRLVASLPTSVTLTDNATVEMLTDTGVSAFDSVDTQGHVLTLLGGNVVLPTVAGGGTIVFGSATGTLATLIGTPVLTQPLFLEPNTELQPGTVNTPPSGGFTVAPGILTAGALTFQGGGLHVAINGPAAGTDYSQVQVNGPIDFGGTTSATLDIDFNPAFDPAPGESFVLMQGTSISGTFKDLPDGASVFINRKEFQIHYTSGAGGSQVVLTRTTNTTPADVWTGNSLSHGNNWRDPGNWLGNVAPNPGDRLVFPDGPTLRNAFNDFPAGTSFTQITFSGTSHYDVSGNAVVLTGGIQASSPAGGDASIHFDQLTLGADQSFVGPGLTISDPVNLNGHTLTLDGQGTSVLGGVVNGAGALVKQGSGEWQLIADNAYTGQTSINVGDLFINHSDGLGNTGGASDGTTVASGASLRIAGGLNLAEPLTVSGTGSPAVPGAIHVSDLNGNDTLGPITLAGATTFFADTGLASLTLAGDVQTGGADLTLSNISSTVLLGSVTGGGQVINQGQTFSGTGSVQGTLAIARGTLSPGVSGPGVLTAGSASFGSGTHFQVILTATGNSRLVAAGAVDLSANPLLDVHLDPSFRPEAGKSFVILNSAGLNGLFSDPATGKVLKDGDTVTVNGSTFVIRYVQGSQARGSGRGPADPAGRVVLFAVPAATLVTFDGSVPGAHYTIGQVAITVSVQLVQPTSAAALGLRAPTSGFVSSDVPVPGTVTFIYTRPDGSTLRDPGVPLDANGQATDRPAGLSLGTYRVTVTYDGYPADASLYQASTTASPVNFTVDPKGTGPVSAVAQAGGMLFAIRGGVVYRFTSTGWQSTGLGSVASISAAVDGSGNAVLFAATVGNDLFTFDPVNHLVKTPLRFIQSLSAVTDAAGHAVVFVVTVGHDLFEYGPAIGLVRTGLKYIDQISTTTDAAGNPIVFAITQGHDLFSYGATLGLHNLQSKYLTAITAVQDGTTGQAALYATTQGNDLFYNDGAWHNLNSKFIQALSAGTDSAGRPEVYAITQAGDLAKFDAQVAVTILHPSEAVGLILGLDQDRVVGVGSDGAVLESGPTTGWMNLGIPGG